MLVVCIAMPFGGIAFLPVETGGPNAGAVDEAVIEVLTSWGASGNQGRDFVGMLVCKVKPGGGDSDFSPASQSSQVQLRMSRAVAIS
jgi:hypothetical protein